VQKNLRYRGESFGRSHTVRGQVSLLPQRYFYAQGKNGFRLRSSSYLYSVQSNSNFLQKRDVANKMGRSEASTVHILCPALTTCSARSMQERTHATALAPHAIPKFYPIRSDRARSEQEHRWIITIAVTLSALSVPPPCESVVATEPQGSLDSSAAELALPAKSPLPSPSPFPF
jgi:hypothetical protein